MSTFNRVKLKCAICGEESVHIDICSTNEFGSPDLDLRPAPMNRDTMCFWVQECPHCGYVASDIDEPTEVTLEQVKSGSFSTTADKLGLKGLARLFLIQASTKEMVYGDHRGAFHAALHAAWACDDDRMVKKAVACRKLALDYVNQVLDQPEVENAEQLLVQRMDVMRRAGLFDRMILEYDGMELSEEILTRIQNFQLERARAKDTKCYTVRDALKGIHRD